MEAGRLRHWLTFQAKANDQDSDENLVEVWADAFPVSSRMPCDVVPLSGRELMAAAEKRSRVTHRIITRFRTGFDASMRAVAADGTIYNLEAVIPDPESGRRWITFTAYTGTNEG